MYIYLLCTYETEMENEKEKINLILNYPYTAKLKQNKGIKMLNTLSLSTHPSVLLHKNAYI